MRIVKIVTRLSMMLLLLGLALAMVTYAQEPGGQPAVVGAGDEVGNFGLDTPPSAGVLYMFTGVTHKGLNPAIATSVHCTNRSTTNITLEVYFYQAAGGGEAFKGSTPLAAGETKTVSTQNTFYNEVTPNPAISDITQGSGLVRVANPTSVTEVICTVQVLGLGNSETDPPTFMVRLPLFDKNGNPINCHHDCDIIPPTIFQYFPIIIKD